jgi:hypothetical protein
VQNRAYPDIENSRIDGRTMIFHITSPGATHGLIPLSGAVRDERSLQSKLKMTDGGWCAES